MSYRFDYQVGYDNFDMPTSIIRVVIKMQYDQRRNRVLGKVTSAYPVPQITEKYSECKYICHSS